MNASWMRWAFFVVVATSMAGSACLAQDAKGEEKKTNTIVKAKAPIVLDGKLDDVDWQRATVISVNCIYGKKDAVSTEPRMTVRYLWDDAYLYIGYEVFDTNLVAIGNNEMKGPANNQRQGCEISDPQKPVDVVEFFPVFDDKNLFWELHHNAANQFNDLLCIVGHASWQKAKTSLAPWGVCWARKECLADEGSNTVSSAVLLKARADGKPSTLNDSSDVDTGYTAEIRLPWGSIGAPMAAGTLVAGKLAGPWKMAGREVSLLAVFQNGDLTDRYHTSAPGLTPNFFHVQADKFPRYTMVAE
ncbi:MAG: sugar-binding protein [Kiritimatiellia bacterium]